MKFKIKKVHKSEFRILGGNKILLIQKKLDKAERIKAYLEAVKNPIYLKGLVSLMNRKDRVFIHGKPSLTEDQAEAYILRIKNACKSGVVNNIVNVHKELVMQPRKKKLLLAIWSADENNLRFRHNVSVQKLFNY